MNAWGKRMKEECGVSVQRHFKSYKEPHTSLKIHAMLASLLQAENMFPRP